MTVAQSSPTVASLVLRALQRYPGRTAFRYAGHDLSYAATREMIGRFQHVLHKAGIKRGDRIALLSANRADTWCAGVAAQSLGAATTSLHPLGSFEAHLAQLEDADASALVCDPVNYPDARRRTGERTPCDDNLHRRSRGFRSEPARAAPWISAASPARDHSHPDDMASLNFTGGTTGKSKGVMRSSGGMAQMAQTVALEFELPPASRYVAVAPISHVSGTNVLPTLMGGGTVHLLEKFDPEQLLATIAVEQINFALMVPTMIYTLLDHPRLSHFDLSSLELLLYGASPMSPTRLMEGLERIGPVFSQLYGQTECYPIAVLRKEDHDPSRPKLFEACGFPTASSEVQSAR